jgi:hypothetical protein
LASNDFDQHHLEEETHIPSLALHSPNHTEATCEFSPSAPVVSSPGHTAHTADSSEYCKLHGDSESLIAVSTPKYSAPSAAGLQLTSEHFISSYIFISRF